jgi:hypothetical protein
MSQKMNSHIETLKNIFGDKSKIELLNDPNFVTSYKITTNEIHREILTALGIFTFSIMSLRPISNKIEIIVEIKEALK